MEGEPLAAGVGDCVARPGGLQQLLVLQPHAVVQPHSVRLHFRHGHKNVSSWSSFKASAFTAMRLLWLMTSVVSGHPGLRGRAPSVLP